MLTMSVDWNKRSQQDHHHGIHIKVLHGHGPIAAVKPQHLPVKPTGQGHRELPARNYVQATKEVRHGL